jgi:phage portal protein BeeE
MGLVDLLLARNAAPAARMLTPQMVAVPQVPYVDGRAIFGVSAVWRCVTLIADTIADMPWTEWYGDEVVPSSRLVRRPLALRTRRWWTWRVVATEALYNRCYNLHVGGKDSERLPWSLLPLPPDIVQPAGPLDPWGLSFPSRYAVAGQEVDAEQLTIIERAPMPGVSEQLSGLLDIARQQFTAYVAADIHMTRYWQNGGPTVTQITTDQELDDNEAERLSQRWVNRRAAGMPPVLSKGASAGPWGADPTSESAVEARREMTADVGRYFGVPTRILNAPAGDSETYSNVENDRLDLLTMTLRGYMGPIEDAISELLPGDYLLGRRMQLDPTRFLQGDVGSRATAYVALTSGERPILDVDEARLRGFGLPPRKATAASSPTTGEPMTVTASVS